MPKVTPQKSPESYAIGVSDSRSDLFYTLAVVFSRYTGAFHTQLLEIRSW